MKKILYTHFPEYFDNKYADGGSLGTTLPEVMDVYPSEVIDNQYASGGHMSTYRIPKHRKVAETIKMTNGSTLTREVDGSGYSRWFRDGKYITPSVLKTYKFYDKGIKGYRQLKNGFMHDIQYDTNEAAPVYTPTLNKLMSLEGEWYNHTQKADKRQSFKPSKKVITLRTKGSMNLADIPVNMLDSIAINSGRSNTPVKQNLGLVGKESTFGGFSHFQGAPIEKEAIFYPEALTNNHAYFESPVTDYLKTLEKNVAGGYKDGDKAVAQIENRAREDYKHHGIVDNIPRFSPNVMADAFKRYSANPSGYNHNQGNYTSMVNRIGNEVWNEPHIQNWWNTEGKYYYNKGRSQGINYTYANGGPLYNTLSEYFDNQYENGGKQYANGGEMNAPKHWNELSMADKSDAIASAVRNGVTTLEDIRKAWDDYADSSNREDDSYRDNSEDMGNTPDDYDDTYQEEEHEYLKGGYKPSASIKNRIANWEGSSMQTNRSFEAEAKDFWNAIPSNVRSKLSQQQADALYSYSYNVGAGNFKKRVVPSLERYFNGNGSVEDVQRHMYATKDKDYRGLAKRRTVERALFAGQRVEDVPSFNYDYSSNSSPYGHRFTVNNNFQTAGYLGPIVNGNSVSNDNTNKTNIFLQALEDEPKQTIAESTPEPRYNAIERLQNIYSMYGMNDYADEIGKYNPYEGLITI